MRCFAFRHTTGGNPMKWHRFFGWAGTICMVLALYTGYKRK